MKNKIFTLIRKNCMAFIVLLLSTAGTPIHADISPVGVRIDPRVELLYIIWSTTDYSKHFQGYHEFSPYAKEVEATFGKFKGHRAIRLFDEIAHGRSNWAFDGPPRWILHFGSPPKLEPVTPLPKSILERLGGKEKAETLAEAFRAFAVDTNFMEFFYKHANFYAKMEKEYTQQAKLNHRWKSITTFYGYPVGSSTVILAPLCYLGNFGITTPNCDGGSDFIVIDSPSDFKKGAFQFDSEEIGCILFHEFGHSFVNQAVLSYPERNVHAAWALMVEESMRKQGQEGSWDTILCESVVRAGEIRLAEDGGESSLAVKRREELVKSGWFWVPYLAERMREYPANHDRYRNFAAFVPRLLQILDELEPITEEVPGDFHGTRAK